MYFMFQYCHLIKITESTLREVGVKGIFQCPNRKLTDRWFGNH